MKRIVFFVLLSVVFLIHAEEELWNKFVNPPDEARTKVWWFHGETETTEEGIDADLEAFREAGVGGVVFYDQVHGDAEGAFDAMSPEWWSAIKYAARKAQDLGLSFEVAASNGYVAGGPWITPELGMQKLAVIDTLLVLDKEEMVCMDLVHDDPYFRPVATLLFSDYLNFRELKLQPSWCNLRDNEEAILVYDAGTPIEVSAISYSVNPRGKGSTGSMNVPGIPQERYFGALYTEVPPVGALEYSLDGNKWFEVIDLPAIESVIGHKSKERTVSFPSLRSRWFRVRLHDWMDSEGKLNKLQIENMRLSPRDMIDNWQVKSGLRTEVTYPHPEGGNKGAINPDSIHDVTKLTDDEGILRLTLGPGCWHVLRFGYIPTYGRTKHGRRNLLGLEADVMSAKAAKIHYENYFKTICDTLKGAGGNVAGMCMDSHEAGIQNWTPGFERRFAEMRGYELTPWLPTLAGYIVTDRTASEQVLQDFRKTISETITSEFYGTLADLCHADEVTFTSQAMLNIDNDNIRSRSKADKPQGEFWTYQINGNYDCLDAASAAHIYGKPIASGEAFTDTPYSKTWDELLRVANLAYCRGINEFVVCASSYQPWLDKKYDDSASAHPYIFHRLNPEWKTVGPFWDYQARCGSLLREGDPVVDLCIFLGEDFPAKTFAYKLPVVPEGYNFDVCTTDALMNRFSSFEGELAVEGGMRYRALVVQDRSYLSPEVLQKINQLEEAGVPVIRCDRGEKVGKRLVELGIMPDVSFYYNSGTEQLYMETKLSHYGTLHYKDNSLQSRDVNSPHRTVDKNSRIANVTAGRVCFFHRRTPTFEIYFLYNHSELPFDGSATFRSSHESAEQWSPKNLTRIPVASNTSNKIQLHLDPYESTFIVFQNPG